MIQAYPTETGIQITCDCGYVEISFQEMPAFRQWLSSGSPIGAYEEEGFAWGNGDGTVQLCDTSDDYCQDFTVEEVLEALPPA